MKTFFVGLIAAFLSVSTSALAAEISITQNAYCAGSTDGIGVERIKNCARAAAEASVVEACKTLEGVVTKIESKLTDTTWNGNCPVVGDVRRGCTAEATGTCAKF